MIPREGVGLLILAAALLFGGAASSQAQTPTRREYDLKAAMLYRLLDYVDWPDEVFSDSSRSNSLEICFFGSVPFPQSLEALEGKTVQGRKVRVRRLTDPAEAQHCRVLWIAAADREKLPALLSQIGTQPTLTVSDVEGFTQQGGMVNLVAEQNRVLLEINREAAKRARLGFSSQVLRLAKLSK